MGQLDERLIEAEHLFKGNLIVNQKLTSIANMLYHAVKEIIRQKVISCSYFLHILNSV